MVTTNNPSSRVFIVDITRLNSGTVVVDLRRDDGLSKTYQIPDKKVRLFQALDAPIKDAIDFLLG
jgi:hypothetical protein